VTSDPFTTLGLEPRFAVDTSELERRHKELSKALHPDRYASAPAGERRMALSRAIEVNEAFRALRDPVKRAEEVLRRAGVPVGETSEPKPSNALLMEMMESREELAEAARKKDVAAVGRLGAAMQSRETRLLGELGAVLDGAGAKDAALPILGELRYTRRFLNEVAAFEEALYD
jgi:molecular chaperone HscB